MKSQVHYTFGQAIPHSTAEATASCQLPTDDGDEDISTRIPEIEPESRLSRETERSCSACSAWPCWGQHRLNYLTPSSPAVELEMPFIQATLLLLFFNFLMSGMQELPGINFSAGAKREEGVGWG